MVTASRTAVASCPAQEMPRESTRAARQPPLHPQPARKRSEARALAGQLAVDASPRQRAARQELGVPAFRAYPSGLQTLTETAAVCADNLRNWREPVLGEFRITRTQLLSLHTIVGRKSSTLGTSPLLASHEGGE